MEVDTVRMAEAAELLGVDVAAVVDLVLVRAIPVVLTERGYPSIPRDALGELRQRLGMPSAG
jgi:hypothetical protein